MNVSNGRFLGSQDLKNGYTRWDWEVKNPINNKSKKTFIFELLTKYSLRKSSL
jgi:hypothetical protein